MNLASLPPEFDDLECFVPVWSLSGSMDRWEKRLSSSMGAIREFYNAMLPRMDAIMALLAQKQVKELSDAERNLFHLALSFMDVGPAVEIYKSPRHPNSAFDYRRLDIRELL